MNKQVSQYQVGQHLESEGGYVGGFIVVNGTVKTIIVPDRRGEIRGIWLPNHKEVPGANSCCDSLANTVALAEAGSPLAKLALESRLHGKTDWVVGARDVNELLYRNFKPGTTETGRYFRDGDNPSSVPVGYPYANGGAPVQTIFEPFKKGGEAAFDEVAYWSSTQYSANYAWCQGFGYGNQSLNSKKAELAARLVRLI